MKLSDKVYRINLGVPDEFEDMSHYSAYLGNGVVSLEKRIAELEAERVKKPKAITRFRIFAITHSGKNATQMADEIIAALKDAGIDTDD